MAKLYYVVYSRSFDERSIYSEVIDKPPLVWLHERIASFRKKGLPCNYLIRWWKKLEGKEVEGAEHFKL